MLAAASPRLTFCGGIRGERELKRNAITTSERYTLCGGNTNDDCVGALRTLNQIFTKPQIFSLRWPGIPLYAAVILGTATNGAAFTLNRWLPDSPVTVLFWVQLGTLVLFVPGVAEPLPDASAWAWLAVACVTGAAGMLAGIAAVRFAPVSALAPWSCSPSRCRRHRRSGRPSSAPPACWLRRYAHALTRICANTRVRLRAFAPGFAHIHQLCPSRKIGQALATGAGY